MDDGRTRRPPLEDSEFLANLDGLDTGLTDGSRYVPPGAQGSASAPPHTISSSADAPIVLPHGSRRPLLDLFPSAPRARSRTSLPAPAGTVDPAAQDRESTNSITESRAPSPRDAAMPYLALAIGFAGGAVAALWVFRDRVQTILSHWRLFR